jgi:hypothetical protein
MKIFSTDEIQLFKQVIKDELNVDVDITDSTDIFDKINAVKVFIKENIDDMSNGELRKYIQKVEFLNSIENKLAEEIQKEAQEKTELITKLQSLL